MPTLPAVPRSFFTSLTTVAAVLLTSVIISGCDSPSNRLYEGGQKLEFSDTERKEVDDDIVKLAKGKDINDIEGMAIYSNTVTKLTNRGSRIEPQLLERLAESPDWCIRMGIIEVLGSTGTRKSVGHLITACDDANPLVGLNANKLLEAMTNHKVIPDSGAPTSPEGVPPVPLRAPTDLELSADERLWSAWYADNKKLLHDTWLGWWKDNRGTVDIQ